MPSPRDLANVNEWKIMFDPYSEELDCQASVVTAMLCPKLLVKYQGSLDSPDMTEKLLTRTFSPN